MMCVCMTYVFVRVCMREKDKDREMRVKQGEIKKGSERERDTNCDSGQQFLSQYTQRTRDKLSSCQ